MTDVMDFCTHPRSVPICSKIYQIRGGGGIDTVKEECIMKDGPGVGLWKKRKCVDGELWPTIFKAFPSNVPSKQDICEGLLMRKLLRTSEDWFGLERGQRGKVGFFFTPAFQLHCYHLL